MGHIVRKRHIVQRLRDGGNDLSRSEGLGDEDALRHPVYRPFVGIAAGDVHYWHIWMELAGSSGRLLAVSSPPQIDVRNNSSDRVALTALKRLDGGGSR